MMEIRVPELGESILEATVARWLKKAGAQVAAGEAVVELETDKVNVEVSASQAGVLAQIEHPEGDDVKVGDVLGRMEPAGGAGQPGDGRAETQAEAQAPAQALTQASTQASAVAPAQTDGPAAAVVPAAERKPQPVPENISPVARRMAQDLGIDAGRLPGSGPGERVMKADVKSYAEKATQGSERSPEKPPAGQSAVPPVPAQEAPRQPGAPANGSGGRAEERQRMSRRRRTIAARLVEAQHTAAMLTTFNDVDMSKVMELRARHKESFLKRFGVKLGLTSFFVKAAIGALKAYPRLNAEIQGEEFVLKGYYDIGIAVGAEEGLVVPVLRDADRLSMAQIEKKVVDFVEKVNGGTLSIEDLRGGTFSITNGGVFGSLLSTPILNTPQVGILGLHRIEDRPIAVDGQVVIRPMMYMALSYDHRIVDGREAVQFLAHIRGLIQDPEALLLEG